MQTALKTKLSLFMFLQYFIWSTWYMTLGAYLGTLSFSGQQIGLAYGAFAWGAILSPFIVGLIADRYFASEKIIAVLGVVGGLVMLCLPQFKTFGAFYPMLILYCTLYAPTLALGNSVSMTHLADAKKDFPFVKIFSAVGWIAGGVVLSLVKGEQSPLQYYLAGGISMVFGVFALTLPHTPPRKKGQNVPLAEILGLDALALLKTWDFTQPRDSAAAAYFNVFWKNLLLDTFGDELPDDYLPSGSDRWFTVVRNLWATPDDPWWDDKRTPQVETRDDDVVRALDEATTELSGLQGSDPKAWRWGALHTLLVQNQSFGQSGISLIERIFNRGPVETSGGESIVDATGWTPKNGYVVDWVPSMRMVLDLSDLDASTWVHLTGASGHAYDPHYADQLDAWQNVGVEGFRRHA